MNVIDTELPEVKILVPKIFEDARGFFLESFNQRTLRDILGNDYDFVQDNHSRSSQGVIRGLHYQLPPSPQGKLVRVVRGSVFDVAVDVRRSSANFGQWVGVELSEHNHQQLWIPPGFAHGFAVLSETTDFLYKATGYYSPSDERSVRWDDETIGIDWPIATPQISAKDAAAPSLHDAECFQ